MPDGAPSLEEGAVDQVAAGPPARPWARAAGLGAATGIVLGAIETACVLLGVPLAFDYPSERVRFAASVLGLCAGTGLLVGLCGGRVAEAFARAARRLGRGDGRREGRLRAALATLLALPALWLAVTLAFDGRRARLLPARGLLIGGLVLFGGASVYLAVQQLSSLLRRQRDHRLSRWALVLWSAALVAGAGAAIASDWCVLPRLYPSLHVGLEAVASVLVAAALALAAGDERLAARWSGTWAATWAGKLPRRHRATALVGGGVLWGACATWQFASWQGLRAVAFEHTQLTARLLTVAGALHFGSHSMSPPPVLVPPTIGITRATLPAGPSLPEHDVFLITVDAMRADRLARRFAPRLAAVAGEGVVFDRAYAQVPHTSFSLATLLTGKYVYALTALGADPAGHETLADYFRRERYKTAAFFPPSVFYIDHDHFREVERAAYHFEYVRYEYMAAPGRTDQVLRFLDEEHPARVFAWIHYFDPHEPYELHPGPGAAPSPTPLGAEARYDGEVSFVDEEVGRLIDELRRRRPRAIVVFTADHGEEFGEHGGRYHGTTLYEEQVRVPLFVVAWDEGRDELVPRHVTMPVAEIDLAPTILSLVGITPSARMRGRNLGPWLAPLPAPGTAEPVHSEPVFSEIGPKKMIAVGDDRLICDLAHDFCELYDLGADPTEKKNLAGREPERAARLKARLDAWVNGHSAFEHDATSSPGPELDEGARHALERGRLGDASAEPGVARLLLLADARVRREAALVLLRLPDDAATHNDIAAAHQAHADEPLLAALALRAGDSSLADSLAAAVAADAGARVDQAAAPDAAAPSFTESERVVRAEIALALAAMHHPRAVPLLGAALATTDDEAQQRRLLSALGASGQRAALAPLVAQLPTVRTRADVVRALGVLHDSDAVEPLCAMLGHEPYVTVRAEVARVLGLLASRGDERATSALGALVRPDEEPVVVGEALVALAHLGGAANAGGIDLPGPRPPRGWSCAARGCVPPSSPTRLALPSSKGAADRLVWLVTAEGASGAIAVGDTRLDVVPERRSYTVTVGRKGMKLRTLSGQPRLLAVFAPRGQLP